MSAAVIGCLAEHDAHTDQWRAATLWLLWEAPVKNILLGAQAYLFLTAALCAVRGPNPVHVTQTGRRSKLASAATFEIFSWFAVVRSVWRDTIP